MNAALPAGASIESGEVVISGRHLAETLAFFEQLGFRVDAIHPADSPRLAVVSGHGLRLRLDPGHHGDAGRVRLRISGSDVVPEQVVAPNGTVVDFVAADPPVRVPPPIQACVVSRATARSSWAAGRAGMQYRDLIPGRLGGRFIASHIRVPDGGPVPDYVHFHKIRFQMIYCRRGWVRLVYEGQGPPFVLYQGDCVLQPPRIRHRVLESSAGLEVVELSCPAEHETIADHHRPLPTGAVDTARLFEGQRFVRHTAVDAPWTTWSPSGGRARDVGIRDATAGLAAVSVVRLTDDDRVDLPKTDGELLFWFVLAGSLDIHWADGALDDVVLGADDSITIPAGHRVRLGAGAPTEFLEVRLPG